MMTVPFIVKRSRIIARQRDLNGSTLNDVIAQTSPAGNYSSWYLADLNQTNLPSLEAALNRERYLMLTPFRQDLQVGSIVQIVGGREQLVASVGDCLATDKTQFPFALPSTVTTSAGIGALPRYFNGTRSAVGIPDISSIEIKVDNPVVERIARERLSDQDAKCIPRDSSASGNNPVFVVTSLLTTSGLRYRLVNNKQQVLHPTISQLEKWGLAGKPDTSNNWSVVVEGAYSIAYQAGTPNLETAPMRWQDLTDPSLIKPGASQDIRSRTEGRFLVPVATWQLDVLLPQRDLMSDSSALRKITLDTPGVYVLPATGVKAYAQSVSAVEPAVPIPTIADVKDNRSSLVKTIHWPTGQPILQELSAHRIILTIGERDAAASNWRWLPEFVEEDGRTNVFRDVKDSGVLPIVKPDGMTQAAAGSHPVHSRQITETDHPAYIAGLIAGRDKDVPSLMPNASLFFINLSNTDSKTLTNAIDDANTNNISVVSLSQILPVDDDLLAIKTKIKEDEWRERLLFVTAAGNNDGKPSGEDVDNLKEYAFISWASHSPQNVLGVAASDPSDDHLIKHCKPEEGASDQACSNFGKKYVQLSAPGFRVYGLGANDEYLWASGTSVAVPQVAAAAAMLKAEDPNLKPYQLKARLIYTADYNDDYIEDTSVWGGRLNVERALAEPSSYLVKTGGVNSSLYRVDIEPGSTIVGLHSAQTYDPETVSEHPPDSILASQILRMYRSAHGTWIVYLDRKSPWRMRMIVHASPSFADEQGHEITIRCYHVSEWDEHAKTFNEIKNHEWLVNGIPIDKIADLVGPIPTSVTLPE